MGDFNGDGKQDLAVANREDDNVSILLGNGDGTFGGATNFAVGDSPRSVSVADFNGDSNQDLAVANIDSDNVSILLGDGSGSFAAATNFAVGERPDTVSVADFNGDGNQDLAVVNRGVVHSTPSHTVSILLGDGSGSFAAATNFETGVSDARDLSVGDFNGDSNQDLAVVDAFGQEGLLVSILLGDGSGSFGAATTFEAGKHPFSVAVTDFNGDGITDLAVANLGSNNVSILLGDGERHIRRSPRTSRLAWRSDFRVGG